MEITKERTRIIFKNYTPNEKIQIEDLVGTVDKVFTYQDPDDTMICFPPGMIDAVKQTFPKVPIKDQSSGYWDYAYIKPVQHDAKPRNQLQTDFINFVLNASKKNEKVAGILSPGTGKEEPNTNRIPTPDGYKLMGDIKVGDFVFGSNGMPTKVLGVFPQGVKEIYKITFSDGRTAVCGKEHLWNVRVNYQNEIKTLSLSEILKNYHSTIYEVPNLMVPVSYKERRTYRYPAVYGRRLAKKWLKGNFKTIPDRYRFNSEKVRRSFLYGIYSITTVEEMIEILPYDVACVLKDIFLSLGGTFRNADQYEKITQIKCVGKEFCTCIRVEAEDQLYLTENFIVTHNTFMSCYSAIAVGLRTLIIAPTSGIKVQWAETLTNMFHVPSERVKVVMSPKDFFHVTADFVVVSQASLASLNKNYNLEAIMKANKFGIKIIDEVQMWFHNIIKVESNCNICHNWYLTGTFGRSGDEENQLYQHMFGDFKMFKEQQKKPTLFNRKPGNIYGMKPHMNVYMMWTHSGLSKEEIHAVSNSIRYSERAGKWMRYGLSVPAYTELIIPSDGTMTKYLKTALAIIKMAEKKVTYGKTLILTSTIAAVGVLQGYVSEMLPDKRVGVIHSKQSKSDNIKAKAESDILISTVSSCGTGFDLKGLAKLIVLSPFKSWILTDQVSGRLRVRDDGKDTYMWDVVDAQVPQLRAWANNRADVLKRKSKSFKVIDMN